MVYNISNTLHLITYIERVVFITEMHLFIQIFENAGCKVDIVNDPCGYEVFVETPLHQSVKFIFSIKGKFVGMIVSEI